MVNILQKWCQCVCGGFSLQSSEDGGDELCWDEAECHKLAEILEGAVVCGVCCLEAALLYMPPCGLCEVASVPHLGRRCVLCATWHLQNQALCARPGDGEAWYTVDERQLCRRSFYVETSCTLPVAIVLCILSCRTKANRKQLVERLSHDVERGVPSLGI